MDPRLLFAWAALAVVACSGNGGSPTENTGPEGDILVRNNFFEPATYNAIVGTPVVWAWAPGAAVHNVVFNDGAPGSGEQSSGSFQRTFTTAGIYPYHCSIHGADVMSGVVNAAAAGTGDGGGGTGGGGGGTGGGGYDY